MLPADRGLMDARASQGTLRHGARCPDTLRSQRQRVSRRAGPRPGLKMQLCVASWAVPRSQLVQALFGSSSSSRNRCAARTTLSLARLPAACTSMRLMCHHRPSQRRPGLYRPRRHPTEPAALLSQPAPQSSPDILASRPPRVCRTHTRAVAAPARPRCETAMFAPPLSPTHPHAWPPLLSSRCRPGVVPVTPSPVSRRPLPPQP
jgi:hypothetical protein